MRIEYIIIIAVIVLIVGICFCLAIASFGYDRFYDNLVALSKVTIENSGLTAYDYVQAVNATKFGSKLEIVAVSGMTDDAYGGGKVFLSQNTLQSNSVASFAIISHELGHALQDKEGKLKKLIIFRKLIRFLGFLFVPLLVVGLVLFLIGNFWLTEGSFWLIGIILMSGAGFSILLALLLKIVTISIEKDASKRALVLLESVLNKNELKMAKKLLNSAKLTYWGDFFRAIFGWTRLTKKGKIFFK